MLLDIHSHILPQIDDGSSSMKESLKLMSIQKEQGADAIIATPHFYADYCDLYEYTQNALEAFNHLKKNANEGTPELFLGYEVKYFNGISENELTNKLTLGNTEFILVEMPYAPISEKMLDEIEAISLNLGLTPILAHVDRYVSFPGFRDVMKLVDDGYAKAQINADSILCGSDKRKSLKLISDGYISYLGSDAHSVNERPPRINEFKQRLNKKLGPSYFEKIEKNSLEIYQKLRKGV
ncbi:MAG: hypothetical protein PHV07_10035 [Oscillospiraceae bacterium]|nr:hypothetical protein [Oscillospiraceae bacterium]